MKKAFTVAEGLVTLIIIGVLAGVMVSSVVKEKPDKNKIMIRNAYAELTGVVNQLVADSVLYPDFAEFGLADSTKVVVHYAGTALSLGDNREKMCLGMRHYYNTITQEYLSKNYKDEKPCRASFYTKNGALVRFEVDAGDEMNFTDRCVVIDVNPANSKEVTSGDDTDTLKVCISKSGKMTIEGDTAKSIISEAQIK